MFQKVLMVATFIALLPACASQPATPATEIIVKMTDFAFRPTTVTVPAGQPVTLTVENEGNLEHDFVIEQIAVTTRTIRDNGSDAHHGHGEEPEYDLHISARPGEASVLEVTALEPGTYQVFCSVEGHKEAGMIGELIVLDQQ